MIYRLRALIAEEITKTELVILSGQIATFDVYRYTLGKLRGLESAAGILNNLIKEDKEE